MNQNIILCNYNTYYTNNKSHIICSARRVDGVRPYPVANVAVVIFYVINLLSIRYSLLLR